MKLNGKVAVVTGGGSSIGKSIAEHFHRDRARVLVADISGVEKDVAASLGECAAAFSVDVSDENQVRAMIDVARAEFDGIDILSNNAGIDGVMAPYCSSKGGVVQLTRVGALEAAPAGIRVNAIFPGVIDTPLVRAVSEATPEKIDGAKAMTPMGRIGHPDEVAALAVFLASDDASFLTGAAIPIDGGYSGW